MSARGASARRFTTVKHWMSVALLVREAAVGDDDDEQQCRCAAPAPCRQPCSPTVRSVVVSWAAGKPRARISGCPLPVDAAPRRPE